MKENLYNASVSKSDEAGNEAIRKKKKKKVS